MVISPRRRAWRPSHWGWPAGARPWPSRQRRRLGLGDTATTEAADQRLDRHHRRRPTHRPDAPAEATVIGDEGFGAPTRISITVGDEVTWTNNDGTAHTVTADDDSSDSGNLDSGATFPQTFDEAGEFAYHCNIHCR